MGRRGKGVKPELKTFGGRLRRIRKTKGIDQVEFADTLGYSRPQIQRYESGIAWPSKAFLESVAWSFNIDLHWLITGHMSMIKEIEVGPHMAVEVLRPYVEAYLGTVFESSARIQEEITELETNPDQKSYDGGDPKERVAYLRKLLHRELNYYGKVVDDLRAVGIIEN